MVVVLDLVTSAIAGGMVAAGSPFRKEYPAHDFSFDCYV